MHSDSEKVIVLKVLDRIIALYKHVIKFDIFSAPPRRVEINNLPAAKITAPPPGD